MAARQANDEGRDHVQQRCLICCSTAIRTLLTIPHVPVFCNVLWPTANAARDAARATIQLTFCSSCGHVFNGAFEVGLVEYDQQYENSLHFSPSFQAYADALVNHLIDRYQLAGKMVIDVGGGKGEFLEALCARAGCAGIGFDPSYIPNEQRSDRVTFIQDYYTEHTASAYRADLICCRHVLEHIPTPREFLASIRRSITPGGRTPVFFEVPNVLYTLRDLGIWDLIYEHVSYFSPSSLAYALRGTGFEVDELRTVYSGQFLTIEGRPAGNPSADVIDVPRHELDMLTADADRFAENYRQKAASWTQNLHQLRNQGRRAVVWGAGSKGVTFLNVLDAQRQVEYVIDINPRKRGMYVSGTGQQIMSPEFLREYQPNMVILMNPIYEREVRQTLDELGVAAEITSA